MGGIQTSRIATTRPTSFPSVITSHRRCRRGRGSTVKRFLDCAIRRPRPLWFADTDKDILRKPNGPVERRRTDIAMLDGHTQLYKQCQYIEYADTIGIEFENNATSLIGDRQWCSAVCLRLGYYGCVLEESLKSDTGNDSEDSATSDCSRARLSSACVISSAGSDAWRRTNTHHTPGPQKLTKPLRPFLGRRAQELVRRHLRKDKTCCKRIHPSHHPKITFVLNVQ